MYEKFYGLTEKPFNVTPDPRFLYLSSHHREALAHLQYGIQERKGFVAITGEVGTGKTTLVHALLNSLNSHTKTAFIFSTSLTAKGLLKMMVADFGIETKARTKTELLLDLNAFLLRQFSSGADTVLIVDEAQNLSFRLLEEIRMLSNLETDREKLLQIILVGQPELAAKLDLPQLRQLRQRIGSRYHICPLNRQETAQYIRHRLRVAGLLDGSIFDGGAEQKIYRWSGGIPRLINMICDSAMLLGYTCEKRKIGTSIIDEAIGDLQALGSVSASSSEPDPFTGAVGEKTRGSFSWWRRVFRPLIAASGLLLGAALLSLPLLARRPEREVAPGLLGEETFSIPSCRLPEMEIGIPLSSSVDVVENPQEEIVAMEDGEAQVLPYSVQVASFQEEARANALAGTLRQEGYETVFIVPVHIPELGQWHRVMVGRYENKGAARQAVPRLLTDSVFRYAIPWRISTDGTSSQSEIASNVMRASPVSALQGVGDE